MYKHIIICISIMVMIPSTLLAQVTFEGCVDFRGISVASVPNTNIPDIAMATYAPNGTPIVLYNPVVLAFVRQQTRIFFYAHECAHHALGHSISGLSSNMEEVADCWAIQKLVDSGRLSDSDVTAIQSDIIRFGRGDWMHLPGPMRAFALRSCLGSGSDSRSVRDSWDECYDRCQRFEERCSSGCQSSYNRDRCSDRCQSRFDSCTDRCR